MYTRSKIQQVLESVQIKNNLKEGLKNIMDKYNIEDSIFTIYNNNVVEVTKGYCVLKEEFDNLDEAISKGNIIRVINNSKFYVVECYNKLADCPHNSQIFDIEQLKCL